MTKRLLFIIWALLFVSAGACAQGGCTGQKPLNGMTTGGYLKGVANASVRVCSDTLNPCTTIPLYSDAALTQSISNPVTTDATGNYQYCAAPGSYNEQISGSGISGPVNNTPVTIAPYDAVSSGGDITFTGNNTFTSALTAKGVVDTTYPVVWAWVMFPNAGNDHCLAMQNAVSWVISQGWTAAVIQDSGVTGPTDCSVNPMQPLVSPLVGGTLPMKGSFKFRLSPSAKYLLQAQWSTGYGTEIDGQTPHADSAATTLGTFLQASACFPQNTPLVSLGCASGTGGSCNAQGVHIHDLGLSGIAAAPVSSSCTQVTTPGSPVTGATGVFNGYSQNQTEVWNLKMFGFDNTCLDIEQEATSLGGSQQSGPYHDMMCVQSGLNNANSQMYTVGRTTAPALSTSLYNLSGQGSGNAQRPTTAIQIDAGGVSVENVNIESVFDTITVNKAHGSVIGGIHIKNVFANNASFTGHSAVNIAGGNNGLVNTNVIVEGVHGNKLQYLLTDVLPNGFNVPYTIGEQNLHYYERNGSAVRTTSILGASNPPMLANAYFNSTHQATKQWVPADLYTDGGVESMSVGSANRPLGIATQGRFDTTATHQTTVAYDGQVPCLFPNNSSVTKGDYVVAAGSGSQGCTDTGSMTPPTGWVLGTVATTYAAVPSAPPTPTVTPSPSGGATTYSYAVVQRNPVDQTYSAASAAGTTTTGPSSLDSTHFNTLSGMTSCASTTPCDIYRTAGSTTGWIGQTQSTSFTDVGYVGDGRTAPATGALAPAVNMKIVNFPSTVASTLICSQNSVAAVTGNGAAQDIYTCSIPSMPAGGCVRAMVHITGTFTATGKVFGWQFGATSANYPSLSFTSSNVDAAVRICNDSGSTTAQTIAPEPIFAGTTLNTNGTTRAAETTTGAVTLRFQMNAANTESATGKNFVVFSVQ